MAGAILYAAEHPRREIVVGGAGQTMLVLQRLFFALMNALMNTIGFQLQQTKEPKAKSALDNLFEPISDNRVEGDFSDQARPSVSIWLNTHPAAKWGAMAAVRVIALPVLANPSVGGK